jgi:hypothetical protein
MNMDIRLKHEASSIAQALYGLLISALIVLGMSGAIYKLIGPRGVLESAFGAVLRGEFALLLALGVAGLVGWAASARIATHVRGRLWGATTYLFGMLGVLFALRLATLGTL